MKKVYFLANAYSPHVRQWLYKNKEINVDVDVLTIDVDGPVKPEANISYIGLPILRKFKLLQYIYAGLYLRCSRKYIGLLHAHNTSGYGLTAYLSGRDYYLTTYGSEIYSCDHKSALYYRVIKMILDKALRVSSTTQKMKSYLIETLDIFPNKIFNFSLGVNETFSNSTITEKKQFIIFSNRRIGELYNTDLIIDGFYEFVKKVPGANAKLILLEGDLDPKYAEIIYNKVDSYGLGDSIEFVKGFVAESELVECFNRSICSISIPKSDQLSSSILESISAGVLPIVSQLSAYDILISSGVVSVVENSVVDNFEDIYFKFINNELDDFREKLMNFSNNLDQDVKGDLKKFYSEN
ncbi:glycosyltransferase [Neptunomonas japonica]|uniref:glycosyltransferase n=1 Tax=Neptunomonas japonica TaxID=417574 RepID=UPI0003F77893|nr:glycosyltransferase [Neptunomonas japonica]